MSAQIDIVSAVLSAKRLVAVCGLIGAVVLGALSFAFKPTYRAEVKFSVVAGDQGGALSRLSRQIPIAALAGFLGDAGGTDRSEALETLRSREFTEAFIARQDLLPRLFPRKWDSEAREWRVSSDKRPSPWDGYRTFDRKIRAISEDRVSGIVTLQIDWRDPLEASAWANDMIRSADALLREKEIAEAERSLKYLQGEVNKTSVVELRESMYRLIEQQINRGMLARVRDEFAFKVLDPAAPADRDDYVRPNRPAMAIVGLLLGLIVGAALAVYRAVGRARPAA